MRRLISNNIGIDHGDVILFSDFEHDGEMWTGDGPRQSRRQVNFATEYQEVPHVQVSLSMWDISNSSNIRVDVQAESVTIKGFEIVFRTWGDTQVARVRVAWTSMGELQNDDGWDLY